MRDNNILVLKNGKKLSYAEYGNPEGIPILVHHGNPGSRLFWGLLKGSPFNPKYRLIAPDRPGYGLSESFGKDSLTEWPGVIHVLMDHLNIQTFYNCGISGGGPYALICAKELAQKVLKTALISPIGPFCKESIGDMNVNKVLFKNAPKVPFLFRIQFKIISRMAQKNPDRFFQIFAKKVKGRDREIISMESVQDMLKTDFHEAYRQGEAGSFLDTLVPTNWPIDLDEVTGEIHIWYGDEDRSIGNMAAYLGKKIEGAIIHKIHGEGHFLGLEHIGEILEEITRKG